jgi:ubiquinone biosynthesis protein
LLQDKVSPFSSEIAKLIVTQSLGKSIEELFILFEDQPVASASIAQVHKAKLHNGQFVAVKILRPLIRQKYNNDLKLLYFCAKLIAKFLPQFKRLKAIEVVDLFKATMHLELDLRLEAAALDEMRDNFILDSDVYIPKLYWTLITNQVLLVEWIDGISIYDNIELIRNNIDPELISQKIAIMFFNQAYRDGFFHADLHPGNILVTISGKIVLLDFGIMGRLSQKDRLAVAEILFAFLHRDYKLVAHVHSKAGYIKHDTNLSLFAQHCRAISESIIGLPMQEISIGKLLMQLFKITEDFGMETQPQLLLLQKTMIVVEGIGRSLNPKTNMWELAEPWIKKWALKNLTMEAKLLRTMKKIITDLTDLD